jgi:hypothetical protein
MRSSLLSLAAASCVALASTAQAADLYLFPTFVPAGQGLIANDRVRGAGLLIYDDTTGTTTVFVSLKHLEANTLYGVKFGFDDSGASNAQAFTSDSSGKATYAETYATVLDPNGGGSARLQVYVWDGNIETIEEVTNDELRAAGEPFGF